MRLSSALLLAASATVISAQTTYRTSSKRGLVFVPSKSTKLQYDNQVWVENGSDLTWYYNYQAEPSPAYANRTQEEFEFVPMLWSTDANFYSTVKGLIDGGRNITHVLGYNEPDGESSTGGSSIDPAAAATNWISQIEPLRKLGVKVGAPAVTGSPRGFVWLEDFFNACADQGTNCTIDFIPIHWYGDFGGLASHMGQVNGTYPNVTQWITEYALNDQPLEATQGFFNMSAEYFDRLNNVGRYSYFGSFRSDVSNVGPNAAMLTQKGQLTDIGSWYLGGAATNNIPKAGKDNAASRGTATMGLVAFLSVAVGFMAL
ncbi:glycoside hydrolase family 128 protein [Cadophora sp. DSE1049]|nr:glycoside hydrolase family 128 protein [Cadophora sp. DSE1049]